MESCRANSGSIRRTTTSKYRRGAKPDIQDIYFPVTSIACEETTYVTGESMPGSCTFEVSDWDLAENFQKHSIQVDDQHHLKNNQGHTSELHLTNFKGIKIQDSDDSIDTEPEGDNIVPGRSFTYNQIDDLVSSSENLAHLTSGDPKYNEASKKLNRCLQPFTKDIQNVKPTRKVSIKDAIIILAQCLTMYSELRTEFPELAKSLAAHRNKICHPDIQNCTQEIFEIIILLLKNNNIITPLQAEFFIKFWKERPKNPSGPQKRKAQRRQAQDNKKSVNF